MDLLCNINLWQKSDYVSSRNGRLKCHAQILNHGIKKGIKKRLIALELAVVRPEVAAFISAVDGRQGLDLQGQTEQLNEPVSILLIVHIFFSE
jgi:hypothetical protein